MKKIIRIKANKTFKKTGEKSKHVDNHCMWIDPTNTNHWIVGCDGGMCVWCGVYVCVTKIAVYRIPS